MRRRQLGGVTDKHNEWSSQVPIRGEETLEWNTETVEWNRGTMEWNTENVLKLS